MTNHNTRRMPLLILIFTVAVLVVAVLVIGLLYRTSLHQQTALLMQIVDNQARTIEGIAGHEQEYAQHEFVPPGHGDPLAATLAQLRYANTRFSGFGRTGEFALARREGDSIVYLLNQRSTGPGRAAVVPFGGTRGEPMRRALSGRTGTVIGPDYRGVTVLAAYAPVNAFDLGVVAKIDMAEVRAPFVRAGLISIVTALVVVMLGSLLFYRITNPVLHQLQASETQMRETQKLAHLGSWTLDLEKNELSWSDEVYRIFGLKPQEFEATYEAFLAGVHPDDRVAVDVAYTTSVRENRDGYEIEHRVVQKNTGEVRTVQERCRHARDASGRIIRSTGMVHDITERKRAEEATRESEEKFAKAFHSAPYAISLTRPEDGLVMDVNESFCEISGYARDEVVGKTAAEHSIWVDPADRPAIIEELSRTGRVRNKECRFRIKTGQVVVGLYGAEVIQVAGKPCVLSSISDITERKRAEAALRVSEERFRAVASNTPDHILVQDAELRYELVVNPQLGLTEQDMLGKTDYDFLSKSDADRLTAMKRQVMQTGRSLHVEAPLTSAKGELEFFEGTYVPRFDPQGRSNGIIGYFRNVTERKRAEEQNASRLAELQRWQTVMLDREDRNIQLKREVNHLLRRLAEPARYPSQADEDGDRPKP